MTHHPVPYVDVEQEGGARGFAGAGIGDQRSRKPELPADHGTQRTGMEEAHSQ